DHRKGDESSSCRLPGRIDDRQRHGAAVRAAAYPLLDASAGKFFADVEGFGEHDTARVAERPGPCRRVLDLLRTRMQMRETAHRIGELGIEPTPTHQRHASLA